MRVNGREGVQGSDEWKALRKSSITGTDISCILGINPWCDKRTLWRRKMDLEPEQQVNAAMQRGSELEEEARQLFCKTTVSCFEPEVHRHPQYEWAISSLDGVDLYCDEILEIKVPTKEPGEEIPPYYFSQMQWGIFCTGAQICHYVVYFNGDIRSWKVERDEAFIAKALEAAIEFRFSMINFLEPQSDKPLLNEITCPDSLYRLDRYNELCKQIEELETQRTALREKIIEDAKGQASKGGGFRITPVEREGAVDYSKIPELKGIVIDAFRNPKSVYWTIKKDK